MYSYQSDEVWSSSSYIDRSRRPATLDVLDRYLYSMMTSTLLRSSIITASLLDGARTSETDRQPQREQRPVTASSSCVASQGGRLRQMSSTSSHVTDRDGEAAATGRGHGALERVTVNLTPRAWNALEATVQRTGDTKTDTINRALQVYNYIEEIMHTGGAVVVQDRNGKPERLRIF
jgi:hypothetical protein